MSRKRTKQYLMLLMVIGLVSIAAGGSGTFASFSAETANNGNYFATGTLILNDKGSTNTCTSAHDTSNFNTGANNGCDTLFALNKFSFVKATMTGASISNGATTMNFSAGPVGGTIFAGDSLTISQGSSSDTVTATTTAFATDTSVDFSGTLSTTYTAGAKIVDNSPTYFAQLTLTNAGTIDADGIQVKAAGTPCSSTYQTGHTVLNSGGISVGSVSSLPVSSSWSVTRPFQAGDAVVVDDATHTQTFIVGAGGAASGASSIPLAAGQSASWTFGNGANVSGPEFALSATRNLCSNLKLSILETDSSFNHDGTNAALSCALGLTTPTPQTGQVCDLTSGTALNALSSNFSFLNLASAGLNAGVSKYFLLAVHYSGSSFDNSYQNRAAANLDLTWHIDQA